MMFPHAENQPVLVLDEGRCWRLLEHSKHGRLATSFDGEVNIVPVNHGTADGRLFLRTAAGSKLSALTVQPKIAFETDGILGDEAWSVVVRGTATVLETEQDVAAARASGVDPWVPTLKDFWVEIIPDSVTGRHFALGRQPEQLDEV